MPPPRGFLTRRQACRWWRSDLRAERTERQQDMLGRLETCGGRPADRPARGDGGHGRRAAAGRRARPSAARCWPCASSVVSADCSKRPWRRGRSMRPSRSTRYGSRRRSCVTRWSSRTSSGCWCHGGRCGSSNACRTRSGACTICRSSWRGSHQSRRRCRPRRVSPPTSTRVRAALDDECRGLHAEYVAGRDPLLAVVEEALEAVTAAPERDVETEPVSTSVH